MCCRQSQSCTMHSDRLSTESINSGIVLVISQKENTKNNKAKTCIIYCNRLPMVEADILGLRPICVVSTGLAAQVGVLVLLSFMYNSRPEKMILYQQLSKLLVNFLIYREYQLRPSDYSKLYKFLLCNFFCVFFLADDSSFASDFQWCCLTDQGSPSVMQHIVSVESSSLLLHSYLT